jgi:hypothetical protein
LISFCESTASIVVLLPTIAFKIGATLRQAAKMTELINWQEITNMKSILIRWCLTTLLYLCLLLVLMEAVILIYARARVGNLMGRGSSPSEVAELLFPIVLFAGIAGTIALLGIFIYWFAHIRIMTKPGKTFEDSRQVIQVSILFAPMFFALTVAVATAFYISYHYTIP